MCAISDAHLCTVASMPVSLRCTQPDTYKECGIVCPISCTATSSSYAAWTWANALATPAYQQPWRPRSSRSSELIGFQSLSFRACHLVSKSVVSVTSQNPRESHPWVPLSVTAALLWQNGGDKRSVSLVHAEANSENNCLKQGGVQGPTPKGVLGPLRECFAYSHTHKHTYAHIHYTYKPLKCT